MTNSGNPQGNNPASSPEDQTSNGGTPKPLPTPNDASRRGQSISAKSDLMRSLPKGR